MQIVNKIIDFLKLTFVDPIVGNPTNVVETPEQVMRYDEYEEKIFTNYLYIKWYMLTYLISLLVASLLFKLFIGVWVFVIYIIVLSLPILIFLSVNGLGSIFETLLYSDYEVTRTNSSGKSHTTIEEGHPYAGIAVIVVGITGAYTSPFLMGFMSLKLLYSTRKFAKIAPHRPLSKNMLMRIVSLWVTAFIAVLIISLINHIIGFNHIINL